jgi:hypothetical protein
VENICLHKIRFLGYIAACASRMHVWGKGKYLLRWLAYAYPTPGASFRTYMPGEQLRYIRPGEACINISVNVYENSILALTAACQGAIRRVQLLFAPQEKVLSISEQLLFPGHHWEALELA